MSDNLPESSEQHQNGATPKNFVLDHASPDRYGVRNIPKFFEFLELDLELGCLVGDVNLTYSWPTSGILVPPSPKSIRSIRSFSLGELRAALRVERKAAAIKVRANAAWMRRQHNGSGTDNDRLLDRMSYEDHRATDRFPQAKKLLLHAAPGQRVEGGKRFVEKQDLRLHRQRSARLPRAASCRPKAYADKHP